MAKKQPRKSKFNPKPKQNVTSRAKADVDQRTDGAPTSIGVQSQTRESQRGELATAKEFKPRITAAEIEALRFLAKRPVWNTGFEAQGLGVWEAERLDTRGWLRAIEIDLEPTRDGVLRPFPRGPWFQPTANVLGDGRQSWPAIINCFQRAARVSSNRIYSAIGLSDLGRAATDELDPQRVLAPTPIERVVEAIERVSADWRRGDEAMADWSVLGTETGGFEKIVGEDERAEVRRLVTNLRLNLMPGIETLLEPGLREDLRALIRDLDPDDNGPNRYGETTTRWRHTWAGLFYYARVDEVVARLLAISNSTQSVGVRIASDLTTSEARVWELLSGKALTGAELAILPGLSTSDDVVREHVKNIRLKLGKRAIESRSGYGYFRPDAPPKWSELNRKRRKSAYRAH